MANNVFPQDTGTELPESDIDRVDAAQLAQLAHIPNAAGIVITGLSITYDGASTTADIGSGVARLTAASAATMDYRGEGGPAPKVLSDVTYAVETDGFTDLTLTDGALNYIHLFCDPGSQDFVDVSIDTDDTPPSLPSVTIGTVDTSSGEVTELNRAPDGEFSRLLATELSGRVTDGQTVTKIDGTNLTIDADGVLNASGGATDFEALSDVDSGVIGDRPAASTQGNWWFATDGGVYYDDGAAWQTVAEPDTDTDSDTDTHIDVDDGTTTVTSPSALTFAQSGAASVELANDGDGSATLTVSASDSDTTYSAGTGLSESGGTFSLDVVASGTVTLSGGSATVDTGVPADGEHYLVAPSPRNGADIAMSIEDDTGGTGNYVLHIEENTTSVGNPTVGWKLVRA